MVFYLICFDVIGRAALPRGGLYFGKPDYHDDEAARVSHEEFFVRDFRLGGQLVLELAP